MTPIQGSTLDSQAIRDGRADDVVGLVSEILGYDVLETDEVMRDQDLFDRVTTRLSTAGELIPAEDVLRDLHDEE